MNHGDVTLNKGACIHEKTEIKWGEGGKDEGRCQRESDLNMEGRMDREGSKQRFGRVCATGERGRG